MFSCFFDFRKEISGKEFPRLKFFLLSPSAGVYLTGAFPIRKVILLGHGTWNLLY
jgi:hypothetical protein